MDWLNPGDPCSQSHLKWGPEKPTPQLPRQWPGEAGEEIDGRRSRMKALPRSGLCATRRFCPSLWQRPSVALTGGAHVILPREVAQPKERTWSGTESHVT